MDGRRIGRFRTKMHTILHKLITTFQINSKSSSPLKILKKSSLKILILDLVEGFNLPKYQMLSFYLKINFNSLIKIGQLPI